jgi:hypothetical protein
MPMQDENDKWETTQETATSFPKNQEAAVTTFFLSAIKG